MPDQGRVSPDSSTQVKLSATMSSAGTSAGTRVCSPSPTPPSKSGPNHEESMKISSSSVKDGTTSVDASLELSSPCRTPENEKQLASDNGAPALSFPVSAMLNDLSKPQPSSRQPAEKRPALKMPPSPHGAFPLASPQQLHLGYAHAQLQQYFRSAAAAAAAAQLEEKNQTKTSHTSTKSAATSPGFENPLVSSHALLQAYGLIPASATAAQFNSGFITSPSYLTAQLSLLNSHLLHQNMLPFQANGLSSYPCYAQFLNKHRNDNSDDKWSAHSDRFQNGNFMEKEKEQIENHLVLSSASSSSSSSSSTLSPPASFPSPKEHEPRSRELPGNSDYDVPKNTVCADSDI
ncbi:hypothetical protein EGW08_020952 [Elysia chlorotica]|uniref:Uncharacterized protein n=1 Tax=Elysia chlorotica TaxID=188477 RepID=A0A3S1H338_ELYCH|nr:hypothetical protein EGW08_020952 [Elysia chlorotica]